MDATSRIDTFISVLREASKAGLPASYASDPATDKLITLMGNASDLCWEIVAATKRTNPANKIIAADSVKFNATNIINISIAELKNLGHTTEDAIELIANDGALWCWSFVNYPLDTLDRDIAPLDRIQSVLNAIGQLTEWWPSKITPRTGLGINQEIEQAFVNLAYNATCAIIAHNN